MIKQVLLHLKKEYFPHQPGDKFWIFVTIGGAGGRTRANPRPTTPSRTAPRRAREEPALELKIV